MNFGAPLTSVNRQQHSEAPNVRGLSSRDSRLVSGGWRKAKIEQAQNFSTNRTLAKIQQDLGRLKHRVVGGTGIVIQDFMIVSDGGDYYNCYTFDGLTAGTTIIKVAKHLDLQCITSAGPQAPVSPLPLGGGWYQKLIRTVTYTYTYTPTAGTTTDGVNVIEYVRGVTGSNASSETDYVTPCLNVNDIITGFQTSFAAPATLVRVTWQAMADGRAWAAQP